MGHSRLSASASSRWLKCPGSIAYIEFLKKEGRIPESTTSEAAERGTAVHTVVEHTLLNNEAPESYSLNFFKHLAQFQLTEHDITCAQTCWQFVQNIKQNYDELFAERTYDLSFIYNVDIGGTADISLFEWGGELHIGDYKNGRGYVDAENNSQMRIYALGAYHNTNDEYQFTDVKTTIIQPNAKSGNGTIRSDEFTVDELRQWEEKTLVPAIELIAKETAQLNPGTTQCKWCDARHLCEANAKQTFQLAQIDFANVAEPKPELPTPKSLTEEQLAFVLENKERLEQFLKACEKHVFEKCKKEKEFCGYELIEKYGNRNYFDDKIVNRELRKRRLTRKEITIQPEPKLMNLTELKTYLKKSKNWKIEEIEKLINSITTKKVTGNQLVKIEETVKREFAKIENTTKPESKSNAKKSKRTTKRKNQYN